jgi:hypothetical protein
VNAAGYLSEVSDVSATAPGPSATLSDPDPHQAGVMAAVSVVGLLCPVNVWVVPDQLSD